MTLAAMKVSIVWLARLGIDQGIFTREAVLAVKGKLGDGAELLDFAQELVDGRYVAEDKIDALEEIAGQAHLKGEAAPPEADPFAVAIVDDTNCRDHAPDSIEPPSYYGPVTMPPMSARLAPTATPFGQLDDFPFSRVASMDEDDLASSLRALLKTCTREKVSDLHLSAGSRPFVRALRALRPISAHVLTSEEALRLNTALLAPHQRALFLERKDFDFALALPDGERYRANLMFHKGGAAGSYRMISAKAPLLEDLGLRNLDAVRKLLTYHNGLVLVTGPVGAGKTTTLAALVAALNSSRSDHIITVEDPIEVVQPAVGCNITQREVGPHTRSFASALKGALREDPDVIVIGELRDLETIEMAISASETGHLVIGTMHTSDAATTLNRLLDVFPPAQQAQIRASVAESLRGIVCQRLLPAVDGGLVLACEILIGNPAVSALVREGKMQGLRNILETGQREGMCLMENTVFKLYEEGRISAETARANILNRVLRARIV